MNEDTNVPPPYQPPSFSPPQPPRRPGLKIYAVIITVVLLLVVLGSAGMFLMYFLAAVETPPATRVMRKRQLQEMVVGGQESSSHKIAVIYLSGIISYASADGLGRAASHSEEGMVGDLREQLQRAAADPAVKAILLRIDSPGGEVTASDDIYHEVLKIKKSGKPVIVSMASLAASGGYYVAAAADHIVASPTTLTGSIGVIMQTFTVGEALGKIGVKPIVYKSGRNKDILSMFREPTPEDAKLVQDLVMSDYDRFLDIVAENRAKIVGGKKDELKAELRNGIADGRVLTGQQALDGKLVDSLGYFEDAVAVAQKKAGISNAALVQYYRRLSLLDLLGISATAPKQPLKLELSLGGAHAVLEPGKRYYLHEAYGLQ